MRSRAPIILLGFDACDIGLLRKFVKAGKLPTFSRLSQEWAFARVRNPYGLFVQTVWPSFFTSKSSGRLGFNCWETVSLNYERRFTSPLEIRGQPFWYALGDAGRKVAVLDVPHSRAAERDDIVEVSEYAAHDRHFGLRTSPRGLRDEIVNRFGFHPVLSKDPYLTRTFAADDYVHRAGALRTAEEEGLLLRDLRAGLQRKLEFSKWIYRQNDWDLFIAIFGESHAVGHQSWYLHDPTHPRHDPTLARALGDPLETMYAALDRALADLLSMIGDECTVLVLLSHGMRAHYDGTYILEPALARFDAWDRLGIRGSMPGRLVKMVWPRLNDASRDVLAPPLMATLRRYLCAHPSTPYFETDIGPVVRSQQRYYMSPNNTVYGGVRINLKGREPGGRVSPDAEFDAVCEQLKQDLASLINVETGDRVVRSVERSDAHYEREFLDELPDLLINWNHDAPIVTVWSPKTGVIHAPDWHWRSGDHRPGGILFAKSANISAGADLGLIENRDLGPTICAMAGVELTGVDGRSAQSLMGV
jgi:predicted AlkP superfamily phosphohydrolase/phosphomutase